ncbi:MAG: 23S rRNA (pseudouridine(1915)-N(3))-methyltransferase RlmH [Candidatus Aminicenantes bacterium]|nr:MAG: 23S rRNA (pseudouridine(1915)-N(3))-methyltransferase RlmH [Candidatus Aminicenantes bacterium]
MRIRILWPGKTRSTDVRRLQEFYLGRINQLEKCEVIETKTAKNLPEKFAQKIKEIEASELEKHFKNDYIICLFHEGKEMSSIELARFLKKLSVSSARAITFVVGGFLGLEERILKKADILLSLSRMTFSHELSRIMLLEQIYRSLMIIKGRQYAK